jgi:hypothetical protein
VSGDTSSAQAASRLFVACQLFEESYRRLSDHPGFISKETCTELSVEIV